MRATIAAVLFLGTLSVGACKKEPPRASATTTTYAAALADPLAAVNAKMPKDGAKLVDFELGRIRDEKNTETYVFVRPIGWKQHRIPSELVSPQQLEGWVTSLEVTSVCEANCEAKVNVESLAKLIEEARGDVRYTREEKLPGERVVFTGTGKDRTGVYVLAYWSDRAMKRHYSCQAWLDDERLIPYLDAFTEICRTARVEK